MNLNKSLIYKAGLLNKIPIIIALIILTANLTAAQTFKGIFWMDKATDIKVYLIDDEIPASRNINPAFNLIVDSDKDLKVIYRTEINSMMDVVKELTPVKIEKRTKYYLVQHNFSRTTIWMSLEFEFQGKTIDSLTRIFYDGFYEIVPKNQFSKNL